MKIYVIGPVSGIEDDNRPAFEEARQELQEVWGCEVEIPHDTVPPAASWELAMRLSIRAMMDCDGVAALDEWSSSKGAGIEHTLARQVGLPVAPIEAWA